MAEEGNSGTDNMMAYGIILIVFCLILWLMWYLYEYEIKDFIRTIRYWQMLGLQYVVPESFTVSYGGHQNVPFDDLRVIARDIPSNKIEGDVFGLIATGPMQVIQLPFTIVLISCGIWCYTRGPHTNNKNKYDLEGFMKAQARNFPIISPFLNFNPSKQPFRAPGSPVPAELPLFSEALGPEEWVAYNEIPIPDGSLDKEVANKAFKKQLGKPWRGPARLPPYQQILLAAFCLKAARKRVESDNMLAKLACSWDYKKKLNIKVELLKEAKNVLKNRDISGPTLKFCNQHAYINTALLRGLDNGRAEGGVLASAQFVWLRGYDRSLWYPLNNLGRQAYHMEALGTMSHYKLEKRLQRPIPRAKVDEAVNTIAEYMDSDYARPVPALDYTGSKKRGIKKVKAR